MTLRDVRECKRMHRGRPATPLGPQKEAPRTLRDGFQPQNEARRPEGRLTGADSLVAQPIRGSVCFQASVAFISSSQRPRFARPSTGSFAICTYIRV